MAADDVRLKSFLLDSGLLSRAQLDDVANRSQDTELSLVRAILASGLLGEDDLRRAVAFSQGIPFVVLEEKDLSLNVLARIPEPLSRSHNMVSFRADADTLEVALLDPNDLVRLRELEPLLRVRILPRLTNRESLKRAHLYYQKALKEKYAEEMGLTLAAISAPTSASVEDLRYAAGRLSVQKVVDMLLKHAEHSHASAVHLTLDDQGFLVRYRVGGSLHDAMQLPVQAGKSILLRLKLLAHLPLDVVGMQDGRFKVLFDESFLEMPTENMSVRVVTVPLVSGEKMVLHLTREKSQQRGYTLESLGLHGEGLEQVHRALARLRGLVVVSGSEDSGKTTLLYTLLDMLAGPHKSVATIEKNITSYVPAVAQTRVQPQIGLSMASGLRALLRQDPDVVMISDIEDEETASLALHAAGRGVLVLAGVSASSSVGGIATLISLGVSHNQLASVLQLSIGTRLVRRLCEKRQPYSLSRTETAVLENHADLVRVFGALKSEEVIEASVQWKDIPFFEPIDCPECSDGYRGKIGIQEILVNSSTIKDLIANDGTTEALMRQAQEEGMLSMVEDALGKAAQGLTSIEEVVAVSRG